VSSAGKKLTVAEREEFGRECWRLSAMGHGQRAIGEKVGINPKTVAGLLEEERLKRRAEWKDEDLRSLAFYEGEIRQADEMVETIRKSGTLAVQNLTGLTNAKITARQQIDKIAGTHAPTRHEEELNVNYRDYTTGPELEELFREIDEYVDASQADGEGLEADSKEPVDT